MKWKELLNLNYFLTKIDRGPITIINHQDLELTQFLWNLLGWKRATEATRLESGTHPKLIGKWYGLLINFLKTITLHDCWRINLYALTDEHVSIDLPSQLMNSELAALQDKLEETVQLKEKVEQFLINSKGVFRQQVREQTMKCLSQCNLT